MAMPAALARRILSSRLSLPRLIYLTPDTLARASAPSHE
jgi:hypothetical protein